MAIYLGNSEVKNMYLGSDQVKAVYKGDTIVWPSYITINRPSASFIPSGIAIDDDSNFLIATRFGYSDVVFIFPYTGGAFTGNFSIGGVGNFRGLDWHNDIAYALGDDPDDVHRYNTSTNTQLTV